MTSKSDVLNEINRLNTIINDDPANAEAHFFKSQYLMLLDDYENGWLEYEWRFKYHEGAKAYCSIFDPEKKWSGYTDLTNKKLCVYMEQGLGDSIQFVRFLREIKRRYDCYIVLICQLPLVNLFKHIGFADEVFPDEYCFRGICPNYDYHITSMSIPHVLAYYNKEPEPYIHFPKVESDKIGIAWTGSTNSKLIDVDLFNVFDKPVYSLLPIKMNRPWLIETELNDFLDTAKLISEMSVVVSVDTAVLHLAGAMGKNTYGLISDRCDWRWGLEDHRCKWYNSVILVRDKPQDWLKKVDEVHCRLREGI